MRLSLYQRDDCPLCDAALAVRVLSAPWLSPLAFMVYGALALFALLYAGAVFVLAGGSSRRALTT